MGAPTQNAFLDRIENTLDGVHSGVPPTLLSRNQCAFAVNVTHRGGKPRTRPVLVKRKLNFADDGSATNSTSALFQGASYYRGVGEIPSSIVASIAGRMFRYTPRVTTVDVQDISISGDLDNPTLPKAWLFQGEEFLIRNDGQSNPLIFDGATTRRSLGPSGQELPPGTVGAYSNGRFVMALPNRRNFIAGDLVYSNRNLPNDGRSSILKINENISILGGAAFAIPINAGDINAMFSVAIPDTSLGQGSLQIGTDVGIYGVTLPLDANLWTNLQQPTQVVSLPSAGPLSDSVALVNMDAWYRSRLGIQSFQVGRRDMGSWAQTPLSAEMDAVLKFDTDHLLGDGSSVEFDNRLLMTCSPYRVNGRGTAHRGIVALDFHNISSITSRRNPDYEGLWTGLNILKIVVGDFDKKRRCFIFALDVANKICLYELLKDDQGTHDYNGVEDVPVESHLVSYSLFGLEIYPEKITVPLKKLICADVYLEELAGEVEVDVKYRSDAYPFWNDWKSFSFCASQCVTPTDCSPPECLEKQYATFRRLPEPSDDCNPATGRLHRTGYSFQLRVGWTGHVAIDKVHVWASPIQETLPACPTDEPCVILTGEKETPFTHVIDTITPPTIPVDDGDDDDGEGEPGDGDPPNPPVFVCETETMFAGSAYAWGLTEDQDPNTVLGPEAVGWNLTIFAIEYQDFLDSLVGVVTVTGASEPKWRWVPSHQTSKAAHFKFGSGSTDPHDPTGDTWVLFNGYYRLERDVCVVPIT